MVKYGPGALDSIFSALSDPIRRSVVERLARGEASVTELGAPHAVSGPAVSRHLGVLEKAGLIERRRRGRIRYCSLRREPMKQIQQWMADQHAFWEGALGRLDEHLSQLDAETSTEENTECLLPKQAKRLSKSGARTRRRPRRSSKPGPTQSS